MKECMAPAIREQMAEAGLGPEYSVKEGKKLLSLFRRLPWVENQSLLKEAKSDAAIGMMPGMELPGE